MLIWVAVTDKERFDFLTRLQPDEVNFWQPSATAPTNQLRPGDLFLFKLHAPNNYIVGGGFFVRSTTLPVKMAWDAFGTTTGVAFYDELLLHLERHRHRKVHADAEIGCNVLNTPFFFTHDDWIPVPEDWARNTQRGKTYDTQTAPGAALFENVRAVLEKYPLRDSLEDLPRHGEMYLSHTRLGQGAFRVLVTDAYHRRCAVTGEKTLPVLEAAYIKPCGRSGPNLVENGLLLRADIHRLFDSGYVTIDRDLRFVVSSRVREAYSDGREYYRYHGARLPNLPDERAQWPAREFIEWHRDKVFVG